jgi:glycosyltransferase involved in cell wall biosynthesis
MSVPRISVIIPAWNEAVRVERLLQALAAQTLDSSLFEVIVIDNGSTDGTADAARKVPVTVLEEPQPGSYRARNAGLAQVRGEYVAFTDADCTPAPDWLERALAAAEADPEAGLFGGRIDLYAEGGPQERIPRSILNHEHLFSFNQAKALSQGVCATANWMSPKRVFDEVGPFDANLKSGGDGNMARRIGAAGYPIRYVDDMVVQHPIRAQTAAIVQKRRRVLGGKWQSGGGMARPLQWGSRVLIWWGRESLAAIKDRQLGISDKAGVVGLSTVLLWAGWTEVIRLSFGGAPRRA